MHSDQSRRLTQLEKENARLKQLFANTALEYRTNWIIGGKSLSLERRRSTMMVQLVRCWAFERLVYLLPFQHLNTYATTPHRARC